MKSPIYISGPMSGISDFNFPEFNRVATELREKGYEVINPAEIEQPVLQWSDCMRNDIAELVKAGTIALLKGWENSAGSGMEITLSSALGIEIIDAYTLEPMDIDVTVDIKDRKKVAI